METIDIYFKGVELTVSYTYDEGDNGVWRDSNGDGYPPTPESVCIEEMTIKGVDVSELLDCYIYDIEELILKER